MQMDAGSVVGLALGYDIDYSRERRRTIHAARTAFDDFDTLDVVGADREVESEVTRVRI